MYENVEGTLYGELERMGACAAALSWIEDNGFEDPNEAWKACPHAGWLYWMLSQLDLARDNPIEIITEYTTPRGNFVDCLEGCRAAEPLPGTLAYTWAPRIYGRKKEYEEWTADDIRAYYPKFPL